MNTNTNNVNQGSSPNKPEKKFRAGAVTATIWQNQGTNKKTGEMFTTKTVSLQRNYQDKDGNWKTTSSYRITDLPRAALILQKAYEYLVLTEPQENGSNKNREEIVM